MRGVLCQWKYERVSYLYLHHRFRSHRYRSVNHRGCRVRMTNWQSNLPPGILTHDLPGWDDDGEECHDCGETIEGKGVEVEVGRSQGARVVGIVCEECSKRRDEGADGFK